jgi:hypothetical protein
LKVRVDEADVGAKAKRVSRVILLCLGIGAKVSAGEADERNLEINLSKSQV